jgi:metallophosphoesterase superfamily enzyme
MIRTRIVPSHPALILEEKERHMIITDLHIGFEASMISNDIFVKPEDLVFSIHKILQELIRLESPDSLILLGDIKAGTRAISKIERSAVPSFFEIGKIIKTLVIPGNHDGNLQKIIPSWVTMSSSTGMVLDDTLLTHGHVMPTENLSHVNRIIMGHVHPVYFQEGSVMDGQRVWVSIKTDKNQLFPSTTGDLEIIIIPSFNRYLYASQKRFHKKSISPILKSIKKYHSVKIVTLDGSIIGDETMITNVL